MTEREAAPAAASRCIADSRNLVMRIAVAAVLIPLAVAIAYAGGWLWTALVTLAAIGLFVEWLAIVGLAGATRVTVPGVAALAIAGLCFAIGRLDAALIVLAVGFVAVVSIAPERRSWAAAGFLVRGGGRDRLGAGASRSRQGICRADVRAADRVGDRQRRLFRGPRHWRAQNFGRASARKRPGRAPPAGLPPAWPWRRDLPRSIWAKSGRY